MFNKILIYGECWQGTLPQLLSQELFKRGCRVYSSDFTAILPGIKCRSFYQRAKRRLFEKYYTLSIREKFISDVKAFRPDYIVVIKGLHLDKYTLSIIKNLQIPLINWNPDDFFNLKNSNSNLIDAISSYDLIVSPRKHLFDKYYKSGARNLLYLDWYYIPDLHIDHNLPKTIDASFVGSWSPSREEFIGNIKKDFSLWGGGWEKSSFRFKYRHKVHNKSLSQFEMSKVFNTSRYNLNLLTHENSDFSNLRFFEVTASNGLLLTERNEHAQNYLRDGEECLMFSSAQEINEIFSQGYDLNKIALLGNRRIINGANAFSDRVDILLNAINHLS